MSSTITVRVDEEIKREAGNIFREVGMDMSTAINVYLRQVIRSNGIPFAVSELEISDVLENNKCRNGTISGWQIQCCFSGGR